MNRGLPGSWEVASGKDARTDLQSSPGARGLPRPRWAARGGRTSSAPCGSLSRGSGKSLGLHLSLRHHTCQPAHRRRRSRRAGPRQALGHLASQMARFPVWGRVGLDHVRTGVLSGWGFGGAGGGPGSPAHLGKGLSRHKQASPGHRAWCCKLGGTPGPERVGTEASHDGNWVGVGTGSPQQQHPLCPGPGAAGTAGCASPPRPRMDILAAGAGPGVHLLTLLGSSQGCR